jgi:hypothetical protein
MVKIIVPSPYKKNYSDSFFQLFKISVLNIIEYITNDPIMKNKVAGSDKIQPDLSDLYLKKPSPMGLKC